MRLFPHAPYGGSLRRVSSNPPIFFLGFDMRNPYSNPRKKIGGLAPKVFRTEGE